MNIRDEYNSKKVVTFDTQERLNDKIDKLIFVMSKLTAHGSKQNKQCKPKNYYIFILIKLLIIVKEKGEDKQEIIMIRVIIRIDIDQLVEIGECHSEV